MKLGRPALVLAAISLFLLAQGQHNTFKDVPEHIVANNEDDVILKCTANNPAEECRWMWQSETDFEAQIESVITVKEFPPYGTNRTDCSLRLSSLREEQHGVWRCGIMEQGLKQFEISPPARIIVINRARGKNFVLKEIPTDAVAKQGEAILLKCSAIIPVAECQWLWQSLENFESQNDTILTVKKYPPYGHNKSDCSVKFNSLRLEQQGMWRCRVLLHGTAVTDSSPPAKITVVPLPRVQFSEVSKNITVKAGAQQLLICRAKYSVEECRWTWKSLSENKNVTELVIKMFPAYGNDSNDCSIRVSSVLPQQEGFWTCSAHNKSDNFTAAQPIKLTVQQIKQVEFSELAHDTEIGAGKPLLLTCRTKEPVHECQWIWKSSDDGEEVVVQMFEAHGKYKNDCSIHFDSVVEKQNGLWTCGARFSSQDKFTEARPVQVTIFSGVAFVQLSQDIQVAIGEPVLLRCVTNRAVELCQWTWQPLNHSNEIPKVIKQFPAFGDENRDCSFRFKSILEEQEGLWSCAVRLYTHSAFTIASPATLTLLPAARVKFLERPEDVRAPVGASVTLRCFTTSAVEGCQWTWRSLSQPNETEIIFKEFSPSGKYKRDCSINFNSVSVEQEGLWGCTVRGTPNSTILAAPAAKLTVYIPEPVNFMQVTQDIQVPVGNPLTMHCITAASVKECQWSWKSFDDPNGTVTVLKQFPPKGNMSNDCSIAINAVQSQQQGMWICSARSTDELHFTSASPTRVTLLQPESVMVALWSEPEHRVTLGCQISTPRPTARCLWQHPPEMVFSIDDHNQRYIINYNASAGICTLIFDPTPNDLGQWNCIFLINNWEMASANLMLLSIPPDTNWLVGVLIALIVILAGAASVLAICLCRKVHGDDKLGLGSPAISTQSEKSPNNRYTDGPSKINFQFSDATGHTAPVPDITSTSPSVPLKHPETSSPDSKSGISTPTPQHIYEHVDRYVSPATTKSIYENLE